MPTLEDTVEFQAITLNDLLEADAKAGVGATGGDDGKYRRWFILSSAAAAIFAVLFVVALATGGKGSGGSSGSAKAPPGTHAAPITVAANQVPSELGPNADVSVSKGSTVLIGSTKVLHVRDGGTAISGEKQKVVEIAVTPAQQQKLNAAGTRGLTISGPTEETPSTQSPPSTTAATTPAGESPTPAPATTPSS